MKNHVYEFDNKIHKQTEGGDFGIELKGYLAQVFMIWWTKEFLKKVRTRHIEVYLFKRYVDDMNMLTSIPADVNGSTLDEKELKMSKKLKEIGDTIHPSIVLETDCPIQHPDKKLPILDLKTWLEERDGKHIIMYEFYQKDVSSKATINARSTLSWKSKHSILVQQTLRILRNCSKNLPWEVTASHLTKMSMQMQYSGFDKFFRYKVISTAIAAFNELKEKVEKGETPLYRSKYWKREERQEAKIAKKKN